MRIVIDGRELNEDERVRYLVEQLGWGESRARQRIRIGAGRSRGDIVRLEATKPLPPDISQSRRPLLMPKPKQG